MVRMGSLGDIVHTLPAAATLKKAFPAAELDWLVERQWSALLSHNPHISRLQFVETRAWRQSPAGKATWGSLAACISSLRGRGYDCALDFQGLIKSALLARLGGARAVVGFHRADLREPLASFFYTRTVPQFDPGRAWHVVERNLALAAAAGAAEPVREFFLHTEPGDERNVRAILGEAGRYAVLSPAAGWEAKRWPEESFARLAEMLAGELGCVIVINCGPGDDAIAERTAALAASVGPLLVRPSLGELIALVRGAALVVAGDTGPLHLAAACGTPAVGIFGPTDPARNGPFGPVCRVARAPGAVTTYSRRMSREAITAVTVQQVFGAAVGLLGTRA